MQREWYGQNIPGPARLIDVRAFEYGCQVGHQDVRLVDIEDKCPQYITLSHCWGGTLRQDHTTMASTLRSRQSRILYDELPHSFRDAVEITRQLRVRYLWIDALCIVQDDRDDWAKESAKMGAIFSNSFLTIAAGASEDCNGGCFNQASTTQDLDNEDDILIFRTPLADGQETCIFLWDLMGCRIRNGPSPLEVSSLADRGWVCQERILSARTLHYMSTQLFWECRQMYASEDQFRPWSEWALTKSSIPITIKGKFFYVEESILFIWYKELVEKDYSRRRFTVFDDRLVAIAGVARLFRRTLQCSYLAGLWWKSLAWGLNWRAERAAASPYFFRGPSWTWASHDIGVSWHTSPSNFRASPKFSASVAKMQLTGKGSDPFGQVDEGWLKISGVFNTAIVASEPKVCDSRPNPILRGFQGEHLGDVFLDYELCVRTVECLVLGRSVRPYNNELWFLLLLEPDSENASQYKRIGVAEITSGPSYQGWLRHACEKTVLIA